MWKRFKNWFTIDHCVDLFVDILLIIWDVISSPILVVMRILRWLLSDWLTATIKKWARRIAHWFEHKAELRKEKGISFIRAYWWAFVSAPFLFLILLFAGAVIFGVAEGIQYILDDLEMMLK